MATNISTTGYLSESDLTECLSGASSLLMTGDLNEKHRHLNSRLTRARDSLLCV
jgi:hypothetical protein